MSETWVRPPSEWAERANAATTTEEIRALIREFEEVECERPLH